MECGLEQRVFHGGGLYPANGATLAKIGNVGVAARRDELFRNLKDVRRDDRITVPTLDGEFVYGVASLQVVEPTDFRPRAVSGRENADPGLVIRSTSSETLRNGRRSRDSGIGLTTGST